MTLEEVLPLRALVLRDGGHIDTARYSEDDVAIHVAVLDPDVLACVSLFAAPRDGDSGAWRIRGVAVHPDRRGEGLGETVVRAGMAESGAASFWCTARLAAVGFWEHLGFAVEEEQPYPLSFAGLHHTMSRKIPREPGHDSGPPPGAG